MLCFGGRSRNINVQQQAELSGRSGQKYFILKIMNVDIILMVHTFKLLYISYHYNIHLGPFGIYSFSVDSYISMYVRVFERRIIYTLLKLSLAMYNAYQIEQKFRFEYGTVHVRTNCTS